MKLDWQWPGAVAFSVMFVVLGGLVFTGKLHPEALTGLLGVLVPSPIQKKAPDAAR